MHNHTDYGCLSRIVKENQWAFCWHPNKEGYQVIADELYRILMTNYPEYFRETTSINLGTWNKK